MEELQHVVIEFPCVLCRRRLGKSVENRWQGQKAYDADPNAPHCKSGKLPFATEDALGLLASRLRNVGRDATKKQLHRAPADDDTKLHQRLCIEICSCYLQQGRVAVVVFATEIEDQQKWTGQ